MLNNVTVHAMWICELKRSKYLKVSILTDKIFWSKILYAWIDIKYVGTDVIIFYVQTHNVNSVINHQAIIAERFHYSKLLDRKHFTVLFYVLFIDDLMEMQWIWRHCASLIVSFQTPWHIRLHFKWLFYILPCPHK